MGDWLLPLPTMGGSGAVSGAENGAGLAAAGGALKGDGAGCRDTARLKSISSTCGQGVGKGWVTGLGVKGLGVRVGG